MRKLVAILTALAVLALVNVSILRRERLIEDGRIVLLQLAPVDPRSMMQGDYMDLRFALASDAFPFSVEPPREDGRIIVALDRHRVATFRRFADSRPLEPNEIALRYRIRGGQPRFATDAFFFQEGTADRYAQARYGEFRVAPDGEMILTALRDERYRLLGANRID